MRISDYKCQECGLVFSYVKIKDLDSFPATVKCESCGKDSRRIWGIGTFDVAEGKLGNAKNGYNNGCINNCSEMGKFKGTKIKPGENK